MQLRIQQQVAGSRAGAAPRASRPVATRRGRRAFTGARKLVVRAAEESSDAAPAAPRQEQRQRRAPRTVTVQMETITPGQEFEGTVTKVEGFGAFVNIGAESDGLVHVSQLSDGYVKNVADVVKAGAKVRVKVLTVDPKARRLALSMKGMGNAPAKGAGGQAMASFEADGAEGEAEDDAFVMEAGDLALDGVVFRVDENAYETEGYDEADEFEAEAEGELALITALDSSLIEGKVASVEDFGVVVEWTTEAGAKHSGLLHVSEMRAPAAAAAAELGAADAAEGDAEGFFADEAEFESEQYVDVGGIDKPSRYYNVGDAISCFVMGVEGGKLELTQDLSSLALDDAVDEEGEADDYEEERMLAIADADEEDVFAGADEEGEEGEEGGYVANAAETSASIYYGQSGSAAKTGAAPAFIRGKAGAAVAPATFPSRGYAVADADLRVSAANRLTDVDDAGDEAELVDFWTDDVGPVPKGTLSSLGAILTTSDEGEAEIVAREGAEAAEYDALELLNGVSDADLDLLVDALLDDAEADEAEVPFRARRNPGSRA